MIRALWQDLTGAARIAADTRSFLRLTADFLLYRPMKFFRPPGLNRERHIRLRSGVTITYRLNRGDIWALHEVWIKEIYRIPPTTPPAVLIDLGANIGLTALYLATRHNGDEERRTKDERSAKAHIIAVEPVTANAELARRNLEQNGLRPEIFTAAVGLEDGTAFLHETLSSTNSTVAFTPNTEHRIPNTIPVVSMATVLKSLPGETAIDLLKIDIEGSEQPLLTGDTEWLHRVKVLIIEFHPAQADVAALTAILESAGLKPVSLDVAEENVQFFTRSA